MKIIEVDNFNRDNVSDTLVCENVNKQFGKIIVDGLNKRLSGDGSAYFYRLVEDDYVLYKFEY